MYCICPVNVLGLESKCPFCIADVEMGGHHPGMPLSGRWAGEICQVLLGMHALSGCDSVSCHCGNGKVSSILKVPLGSAIPGLNTMLGEPDATHSDLKHAGKKLFFPLYRMKSINNARYQLYRRGKHQTLKKSSNRCCT